MGIIRKSLYLETGGLVSPNSKKQRHQMQILQAMQGATPDEIRRAGGRYDFRGFIGATEPTSAERQRKAEEGSAVRRSAPPEVIVGVITEVRFPAKKSTTLVAQSGNRREGWLTLNSRLPLQYRQSADLLKGRTVRIYPDAKSGRTERVEIIETTHPSAPVAC